jgi:hypothetical protein
MFALLLAHNGLNWRWYRNIGRKGTGIRYRLGLAVTMALLAVAVTLLVSSLIVSRELFGFIRISDGFLMRRIHTLAAYWVLVLVSVHAGLHWNLVMAFMGRLFKISGPSRLRAFIVRLAGGLVMAGGLIASFVRGLGSKLSMGHSFDFWEGSGAGFFMAYLSIMGFYIGLAHYSLFFFRAARPRIKEIEAGGQIGTSWP